MATHNAPKYAQEVCPTRSHHVDVALETFGGGAAALFYPGSKVAATSTELLRKTGIDFKLEGCVGKLAGMQRRESLL